MVTLMCFNFVVHFPVAIGDINLTNQQWLGDKFHLLKMMD